MVFYGEIQCQGTIHSNGNPCTNLAYYLCEEKYLCGVHSKKLNKTTLPKNPNAKKLLEEKYKKHFERCDELKNPIGKVIVKKMLMMKNPELLEGFINVFPNFKHGSRKDGFGLPSLSPKSLGPVNHGMPNLPPAKNIENYHQFAKFWEFELEGDEVKPEYFQKRVNAYLDETPYRHKHDKKILEKYGNVNIPKYSIYYDKNGEPHYYNYLDCRYFYCHFYEELVKNQEDFLMLKSKLEEGYNFCICGYDGYEPKENLMEMYLDTSKPFGHEMVLYTMLIENDNKKYPWNIYYLENFHLYQNVI